MLTPAICPIGAWDVMVCKMGEEVRCYGRCVDDVGSEMRYYAGLLGFFERAGNKANPEPILGRRDPI